MKATASLTTVHNARSHRLDAKEVAAAYGLTLRTLARALGVNEVTLRTRSDSANVQPVLRKLVLAYDGLGLIFPANIIPKWMHHPMRHLNGLTPIELIGRHGIDSFVSMVEEMVGGGYA
jgi:hypothetical protein